MNDAELEQKAWSIVKTYLSNATPEQWHIFSARSNYDDNRKALQWLIDNPKLDKATALLIYWYLGAGWYVQFASKDEMQSYEVKTFELLQTIEQRYQSDFYERSRIWFDPKFSEGGRPDDYAQLPVKRPVPDIMLQPTVGEDYVDLDNLEDYDDGLPITVAEELFALYD